MWSVIKLFFDLSNGTHVWILTNMDKTCSTIVSNKWASELWWRMNNFLLKTVNCRVGSRFNTWICLYLDWSETNAYRITYLKAESAAVFTDGAVSLMSLTYYPEFLSRNFACLVFPGLKSIYELQPEADHKKIHQVRWQPCTSYMFIHSANPLGLNSENLQYLELKPMTTETVSNRFFFYYIILKKYIPACCYVIKYTVDSNPAPTSVL